MKPNGSDLGQVIGNYRIQEVIGYGGMGVVYLAKHSTLDRKAAVKVLLENMSANPGIRERFVQEANLMAELNHPNIVGLYDFTTEPRLSLILEYVDGRGLDKMIGQEVGPIPWEKALPLFVQVLQGVGYAHSRGVVHRDIKPANILVSKAGEVKIADFGIAKIAGQKGMTRTGTQMGTLYYESPEQIKGARDVDHRADIYALGMTLYEMLAGRLPFDEAGDTSEFQVMNTIVNRAEHLDPREYYPHVPEWLVGVVQKATELESEKRFQDCVSFLRAIQEHGGLSGTESGYWSGRVASVVPDKLTHASMATPAPSSPGEACPKCGARIKDEMEFCAECGENLMKKCPSCSVQMRWHVKHCPKCGVNIEKKKTELAAEVERKRLEEERKREAAKIAEEKRKAEEARVAKEKEEERNRRLEEAEGHRQRRILWWKQTGWKVVAGLVLVGVVTGYLAYRNSDLYEYHQAVKLYEARKYAEAISAFSELEDYKNSAEWIKAIRYEVADNLYQRGDLTGAVAEYESLGVYRDSRNRSYAIRYEIAEGFYASGDISGAHTAFRDLGGYSDSNSRAVSVRFTKEGEVITDQVMGLEWRVGQDRDMTWYQARNWVNSLGGGWRMPTRAELRGLWDAGISSDNWGPFENSGSWVWSGEVLDSSSAWGFGFSVGSETWTARSGNSFGRAFAVRPR